MTRRAPRDVDELGLDGVQVVTHVAGPLDEHPPGRGQAEAAAGALESCDPVSVSRRASCWDTVDGLSSSSAATPRTVPTRSNTSSSRSRHGFRATRGSVLCGWTEQPVEKWRWTRTRRGGYRRA